MVFCLVDIYLIIMVVVCFLYIFIYRVVWIIIRGEEIDCYGGIDI